MGDYHLPEKWVVFSQDLNLNFQHFIALLGLGSSILLGYQALSKGVTYNWEVFLAMLWASLNFCTVQIMRLLIAILLTITVTLQIMLSSFQNQKMKSKEADTKSKSPISACKRSPMVHTPCDLDLSKLDIGPKSIHSQLPRKADFGKSPNFLKPRPLISPSRLSSAGTTSIGSHSYNLTKSSWVAGGYWERNNSPAYSIITSSSPTLAPLRRSSSQSSGFGSVHSGFPNRSPPESRPESVLEDIDRLSVFSDNVETRSGDPNFRYDESSPVSYNYARDLSRRSILSAVSSASGSIQPSSPTSQTSHWSWLPFLFGFSVAVNVCAITYCVFLHMRLGK